MPVTRSDEHALGARIAGDVLSWVEENLEPEDVWDDVPTILNALDFDDIQKWLRDTAEPTDVWDIGTLVDFIKDHASMDDMQPIRELFE